MIKPSLHMLEKVRWKVVLLFLLFEFMFIGITSPFVVFYGPFKNVTRTIVSTAMATYKHQYIATIFLSDEKIEKIRASKPVEALGDTNNNNSDGEGEIADPSVEPSVPSSEVQNVNDIRVPVKQDNTIERFDIEGKKSRGILLVIKDPKRVRVGYTSKLGVAGEKTSDIAKANNAVAAINGGTFTDRSADGKIWAGTGGLPGGILMVDGKMVYSDVGSPDEKIGEVIALTFDGRLIVGYHTINELKVMNVRDAIKFAPTIILNGKPQYNYSDQGINPRTAIGQRQDGAILFLVMDGRQARSVGSTLDEVRNIMLQHGAWNAINLDGGSSTTMYLNGEVVNNPCDPYGERTIATALYVEP